MKAPVQNEAQRLSSDLAVLLATSDLPAEQLAWIFLMMTLQELRQINADAAGHCERSFDKLRLSA